MDSDRLYLDYNATSPLSASVSEWLKSGEVIFANPSSQHTAGKAARKTINRTRSKIFEVFRKEEKDTRLFFHSGATEALFTMAYSFAQKARKEGRRLLICSSPIDHAAVSGLKERYWEDHVEFYELALTPGLLYDHGKNLVELKRRKEKDPTLLVLYHHLWVHNETGHVSPLRELAPFEEIPDLFIHVDAVQAPGKVVPWGELTHGSAWSFSGHKFGALKGVGFTLMHGQLPFHPLLSGGGQQQGLRGGTENVQGIQSLALALEDLLLVDVAATTRQKERLVDYLEENLRGRGGVIRTACMNSNTVYFYLNDLPSDLGLALFDLNGLMLSAGSACSSGAARPSQVLTQLGMGDVAKNGLRISLKFQVDEDFLNELTCRLSTVFNKLAPRK